VAHNFESSHSSSNPNHSATGSGSDNTSGSNLQNMDMILNEMISVHRVQKNDIKTHLWNYAELSIMVRAFVPEGEIADNLSNALGVKWDLGDTTEGVSREWRCGISIDRGNTSNDNDTNKNNSSSSSSSSTMFLISQMGRKYIKEDERRVLSDLSGQIGTNLAPGGGDSPVYSRGSSPQNFGSARCLPFSLFSVRFSPLSTVVVLSFLESRLPGVMFLSYKREEGSPLLDPIVFGKHHGLMCRHPLAMKVKSRDVGPLDEGDLGNSISSSLGSTLIGFDLRMVKGFAARPILGEEGTTSFMLGNGPLDAVNQWWGARKSLHERVKNFMGIDPTMDSFELSGANGPVGAGGSRTSSAARMKQSYPGMEFQEGQKGNNSRSEGNSNSSGVAKKSATPLPTVPATPKLASPDLKDVDTLKQARTVVVDLGNACWTHRHFTEEIQTRQYRAPEVLIGNKYDTSADMWSLGCICFELLTGDLLFDPRAGDDYDRDEDHLAMFQELLGKMPKKLATAGKYSKNYFNKKGDLKHIHQLKFWPVDEVLQDKYHFGQDEAEDIANFVLPLLEFNPKHRATALECLKSDWLREE